MNNWKFNNIPKVAHFFWGSNPMSYLNYLSILSFKKFNPDWEINLYRPKNKNKIIIPWKTGEQNFPYEGRDYVNAAVELADEFTEVDFGFLDELHDIHKADYMRIHLMNSFGGLWSDFDVLYVKPIDAIDGFGVEDAELILPYTAHLSIGVILAKSDLKFFRMALSSTRERFNKNQYQSLGVDLLHRKLDLLEDTKHYNLPMIYFYPYYYTELYKLYEKELSIPEKTVAVHWYGGNYLSMKYRNIIDEDYVKQSSSTISKAIKGVLDTSITKIY